MEIQSKMSREQIEFLKDNNLYKNLYSDDDLAELENSLADILQRDSKKMNMCESIIDIIVEL